MKLTADGINEHGVVMCECGNKPVHAWEPGEWCGNRVIPEQAGRPWPTVILRRWQHHAADDIVSYSILPEGHTEPPSAHGREGMIYVPQAEIDDLHTELVTCDNCAGSGFYEEGAESTPCTECDLGERIGHHLDTGRQEAKPQALAELREWLLSDDLARRVWEADRDSGWKLLKGVTYRDRLQAAVQAALSTLDQEGQAGE